MDHMREMTLKLDADLSERYTIILLYPYWTSRDVTSGI